MDRMRTTVAVASLITAAALALTGCSTTSVVTGKEYTAAHDYTATVCTPMAKSVICHPQPEHIPASWSLKLAGGKVTVTQQQYNSVKVGDQWTGPLR